MECQNPQLASGLSSEASGLKSKPSTPKNSWGWKKPVVQAPCSSRNHPELLAKDHVQMLSERDSTISLDTLKMWFLFVPFTLQGSEPLNHQNIYIFKRSLEIAWKLSLTKGQCQQENPKARLDKQMMNGYEMFCLVYLPSPCIKNKHANLKPSWLRQYSCFSFFLNSKSSQIHEGYYIWVKIGREHAAFHYLMVINIRQECELVLISKKMEKFRIFSSVVHPPTFLYLFKQPYQ